jgi:REP element-mobilizing transposase RayT
MSIHRTLPEKSAIYFVTFTCFQWLPLIDETSCYEYFNKWFEYLTTQKAYLLGYVIMPNHFHGLIYVDENSENTINQFVANGKRFIAYEIIRKLKEQTHHNILTKLESGLSRRQIERGSKYAVFISSFDGKLCFDREMVETKLNYIHKNPVKGKWRLADDWVYYPYSSAGFYELGESNSYLRHYREFI